MFNESFELILVYELDKGIFRNNRTLNESLDRLIVHVGFTTIHLGPGVKPFVTESQ